jgi:hypothetical protein
MRLVQPSRVVPRSVRFHPRRTENSPLHQRLVQQKIDFLYGRCCHFLMKSAPRHLIQRILGSRRPTSYSALIRRRAVNTQGPNISPNSIQRARICDVQQRYFQAVNYVDDIIHAYMWISVIFCILSDYCPEDIISLTLCWLKNFTSQSPKENELLLGTKHLLSFCTRVIDLMLLASDQY